MEKQGLDVDETQFNTQWNENSIAWESENILEMDSFQSHKFHQLDFLSIPLINLLKWRLIRFNGKSAFHHENGTQCPWLSLLRSSNLWHCVQSVGYKQVSNWFQVWQTGSMHLHNSKDKKSMASMLIETPCEGNHLQMAIPAFEFTKSLCDKRRTFWLSEFTFTCLNIQRRVESIITQ